MADNEHKYYAFLSYSPEDNREPLADSPAAGRRCWGHWLEDALKAYSIPPEFIGQINGRGEIIPEQIAPVFRDESELPEESSLSAEIRHALEQSNCLIVICSPRSAQSRQVNEVVGYFKQLGRGKQILPIVIAGEPNASSGTKPGASLADECYVPALRHPVKPDGTLDTARRAGKHIFVDARHGVEKREILAKDHRHAEADLEMAKIQLIALLIGVGFDGLWWREQKHHFIDIAEARHQAREAQNQVEAVRRQLQEAQRQATEAQKQSLDLQPLPRAAEEQIQEAQNQALTAQNQAREARQQLQEFQDKVRETQAQLEEARSQTHAAESKVLEAHQSAQETQNQLEATRIQAREAQQQTLEIQNRTQADQAQEAQNQILKAQREAQNAQSQLEETRRQAQDAQDKWLAAQNQVQELQNQAQAAQSQLAEARQQVREAQSKVVAAENQAREALNQVQETQNQTRDAQQQALEIHNRTQADQAQEAQNQILKAQRETQNAQRELEETRQQARNAQDKLLAAQNQVQELQNQAQAAQSQLAEARQQVREAQDKVVAAENQTRDALNQIKSAQDQVRTTQDRDRNARRLIKVFAVLAALALLAVGVVARNASQQRQLDRQALAKAAAEASGTYELASGGAEPIRQVLQKIGGAEQDENRRSSLDRLAAGIPLDAIPEVLKTASVMVDAQQRSQFQKSLLIRLSGVNPVSAMTNASAIEGKIVNDQGLSDTSLYFQLAVLDHWMQTDWSGAFNWVCQLPDAGSRQRALDKIIRSVQSQPESESKNKMLVNCIGELVKADIPGTLALAESLPKGDRRDTMIAWVWMKANPFAVPEWTSRLGLPPEIMSSRPASWPWTSFPPNADFGPLTLFPTTNEPVSTVTNDPVQVPPVKPDQSPAGSDSLRVPPQP